MKLMLVFLVSFFCFSTHMKSQSISNDGHPEHFAAGVLIGGVASYFVYKKTGNKWKAWFIGAGAATAVGFLKEAIDPSIGRVRSSKDFGYTVLGGAIGASIVIPLKKKNPKEHITYLF